MLGVPARLLLVCLLIVSATAIDNEYVHCNCDEDGGWSIQSILECQKVSDFLIAVAYFSIPIELLYFVSCSNFPFKWVLFQFIAFIVLCGLTHLLNGWTYYGPHSFQLMLSLTIAKFLTALVSCGTAITLLTLIPLLLKIKVRELFLRQNVLELDQEVGMMKKQKEASWHVRMLTREIRKSIDKHTILDTTLIELSKALGLFNCAVWMPNEDRREMYLTHELKPRASDVFLCTLPMNDPDVLEIKAIKGVRVLRAESALGAASTDGSAESGAVAAIHMPLLNVSNFKGGTPESVETSYAILVLVLPSLNSQSWGYHEMEIVEVVADQVAVALSHASVLEESRLMRDQLVGQNRALQHARENAMMASQARNSFQKMMSHGLRRPMHSIMGLLSMFQEDSMSSEQKILVDTMVKSSNVLSTLIDDVTGISPSDKGRYPLDSKVFHLHSLTREASCLAKCLCVYKGFHFEIDVQRSLPDHVVGNDVRAFQVILHMVGSILNTYDRGGHILFRVSLDSGGYEKDDKVMGIWRSSMQDHSVLVKFELEVTDANCRSDGSVLTIQHAGWRDYSNELQKGLSFSMCQKLVQMMQGNIWTSPKTLGFGQRMTLVLKFQKQPSFGRALYAPKEHMKCVPHFRGLKVVLADDDDVNRTVTKKLLEKLGCKVAAVSSGFDCLSALSALENQFRVVLLDLQMPEVDGFDVAMRIRKFRSRNRPLIIALTASAEEHVWGRCVQVGMNGVIRKPVLLQGIAAELSRVLQAVGDRV